MPNLWSEGAALLLLTLLRKLTKEQQEGRK